MIDIRNAFAFAQEILQLIQVTNLWTHEGKGGTRRGGQRTLQRARNLSASDWLREGARVWRDSTTFSLGILSILSNTTQAAVCRGAGMPGEDRTGQGEGNDIASPTTSQMMCIRVTAMKHKGRHYFPGIDLRV